MKILSGLEYVLKKAQDWEAYASSGVSLYGQLEALSQLILDWRRLELKLVMIVLHNQLSDA
jgi:midasin